jgi:hypothetical protein
MIEKESRPYRADLRGLVAEAAVMITFAVIVYFYGQDTTIMSIATGLIIISRFLVLYRRGDLVWFIMGVILGGGNDLMSMWRGVYYYTPPTILPVPIPVWMLFFWGQAFMFLRRLARFGPFLGADETGKRLLDIGMALDIIIIIIYRFIVYGWAEQPWLPAALFASILCLRIILVPPPSNQRRLMIAILILGPFYEILLIKGGLYVYQHGIVFGMPLWLIIYWVFIIRVIKAVADWMEHHIPRFRIP